MTSFSAPPAFLASIPDRLLARRKAAHDDLRRASELVRWVEKTEHRPSFLDLDRERNRRGMRR